MEKENNAKRKGGIEMLTGRDAIGDLTKLADELKTRDATLKDVVMVLGLLVKLIVSVRGNTVAIGKAVGVEFRKPRTRDEGEAKKK